ncbi:DUF2214 family protein [Luteimonas aquatica]|uniref:DUF2214 family protein n=1 Tax=Luteimonas aquatica TaxID=450364 RepID=UPI001F58AC92|nr:DUF2214 family protein [Luteimonas aquatica]
MLTDLILASLHHLLLFGFIAMLVTESVLLRGTLDAAVLRRLAGVDAGYGATATLLLAVGILRLLYGAKGWNYYLHNPWFHAKIGLFVLAALLSAWPTVRFLRWRKALKADPSFLPAPAEAATLARIVRFELLMVAAIFVCAAAMARYGMF